MLNASFSHDSVASATRADIALPSASTTDFAPSRCCRHNNPLRANSCAIGIAFSNPYETSNLLLAPSREGSVSGCAGAIRQEGESSLRAGEAALLRNKNGLLRGRALGVRRRSCWTGISAPFPDIQHLRYGVVRPTSQDR